MVEKRWFVTVDWCSKGNRGIFCNTKGQSFSKDVQHSVEEMDDIVGLFWMILDPKSIELTEQELKEYKHFYPLAEYSNVYGMACKQ